jgi:hypothetical protein
MDNAGLMQAVKELNPLPEWLITDHDCAYERDMYQDLKISLEYVRNLTFI